MSPRSFPGPLVVQVTRGHIVFGAVAAVLLAGCGTRTADESEPGPSSPAIVADPDSDDEFGKMMTEGAQSQIDERPHEVAALAEDFAVLTGEQVTAIAAQQMSNIVCLDMENTPGPGALNKVSAAMAIETGVTVELMTQVAARAVQYRCPELALK